MSISAVNELYQLSQSDIMDNLQLEEPEDVFAQQQFEDAFTTLISKYAEDESRSSQDYAPLLRMTTFLSHLPHDDDVTNLAQQVWAQKAELAPRIKQLEIALQECHSQTERETLTQELVSVLQDYNKLNAPLARSLDKENRRFFLGS